MKKCIFFLLVISSVSVNAQSIKDALFSGKLKNDSGSVVRKGDDLSTKIDTTTKKKQAEPEIKKVVINPTTGDSTVVTVPAPVPGDNSTGTQAQGTAENATAPAAPRDNNKIWKEYIDSLAPGLKAEVLPNKKIKSGTYYIFVEYEIGVDGQVSINNVSPSPENSFLAQQVKERLTLTAPQLSPVLYNGKPRKSVKKNTFTITKD